MKPLALWIAEAKKAQLLEAQQGDGVAIETLFSGISRGTEKLVFEGRVPFTEHQRMRSPRQEGEFTFPVKYGYCNVGKVLEGDLAGKLVFALHPHQDSFRAQPEELTLIPDGVPAERAVLAANMETALNILWDSGAQGGGPNSDCWRWGYWPTNRLFSIATARGRGHSRGYQSCERGVGKEARMLLRYR